MIVVDIEMPERCVYFDEEKEVTQKACPFLDEWDCCRGQTQDQNDMAGSWDELMANCPIKGTLDEVLRGDIEHDED